MLKIRLFRIGKKHMPFFRIVVTNRKNSPKGGRFVDKIGFWNPLTKEKKVESEKAKYWMSKGAQPSDSVYNLFIKEGVLAGKKKPVHKKSKKVADKSENNEEKSVKEESKGEEKAN